MVLASAAWLAGLTLVIAQMFTDRQIGDLGIVSTAMGVTLTLQHCLRMEVRRNQQAFNAGREVGPPVPMKRVH